MHSSDGDPQGGAADDLWIRGDCDALYLNTGEVAERWVLVQERDTAVRIQTGPQPSLGTYELMRSTSPQPRSVWLEVLPSHQARVLLRNEGGEYRGIPFDLPPDADIRIGARNLSELGYAEITANPGGFVGYLAVSDWSKDWTAVPSHFRVSAQPDLSGKGVLITPAPTLPLELCQRIARSTGTQTSAAD